MSGFTLSGLKIKQYKATLLRKQTKPIHVHTLPAPTMPEPVPSPESLFSSKRKQCKQSRMSPLEGERQVCPRSRDWVPTRPTQLLSPRRALPVRLFPCPPWLGNPSGQAQPSFHLVEIWASGDSSLGLLRTQPGGRESSWVGFRHRSEAQVGISPIPRPQLSNPLTRKMHTDQGTEIISV